MKLGIEFLLALRFPLKYLFFLVRLNIMESELTEEYLYLFSSNNLQQAYQ